MTGQDRLFPKNPILIIDDETVLAEKHGAVAQGCSPISPMLCSARTAVMLVNLLAEKSFSLVLLDLTMPHLSGELLFEEFFGEVS